MVAGAYRLTAPAAEAVTLVGLGAVMPEVLAAAGRLEGLGIPSGVVCLTSPDLLFRALQAREEPSGGSAAILDVVLPRERPVPIVSVLDGHPHTLSFLGAGLSLLTAWLGGELVARLGVGVYEDAGLDAPNSLRAAPTAQRVEVR